jgi:hypothetical protein
MLAPLAALLVAAPTGEHPVLRDIAAEVSPARLEKDVQKLVSFGTRHTLSEIESNTRGIGAARRWIEAEMRRIGRACRGCLEVTTVAGVVEGEKRIPKATEVVNVLAIQRGRTDPDRYVLITGDIDSRVTDVMNATADSPGANDNATGVAAVLETARILSKRRFAATIVYAALSGEEQGLFGGKILAAHAKKNGWRIEAVLNNDMIGNVRGIDGVVDNRTARVFSEGTRAVETPEEARLRRFTGGEVDSPSRNLARYVHGLADRYVDDLDLMMVYRLDRFRRGGHHRPFNEAGFPGVRIMEAHEHYDRQHQDVRVEGGRRYGDTIDGVDFDYCKKLTALNAIALASLAWAPAPPSEVEISGAVTKDTTLIWKRAAKKRARAHGYRVHWRLTTSPLWTHGRWAGDVESFVLEDLVIDNYFFGVSAVSKDGFESPVVFPGPAGRF